MRQLHRTALVMGFSLALSALGASGLHAQDRPADQPDQSTRADRTTQSSQPSDHSAGKESSGSRAQGGTPYSTSGRADRGQSTEEHGRGNEKPAPDETARRDENAGRDEGGSAAVYRREHPGAAARCHDGFFTHTKDRRRACSKHGGIDVWLLL